MWYPKNRNGGEQCSNRRFNVRLAWQHRTRETSKYQNSRRKQTLQAKRTGQDKARPQSVAFTVCPFPVPKRIVRPIRLCRPLTTWTAGYHGRPTRRRQDSNPIAGQQGRCMNKCCRDRLMPNQYPAERLRFAGGVGGIPRGKVANCVWITREERTMSDKAQGLYNKFRVERTDGKSAPGERHDGCEYFVLDLTHDPYAIPAIEAYIDACAGEYPLLASDLFEKIASR